MHDHDPNELCSNSSKYRRKYGESTFYSTAPPVEILWRNMSDMVACSSNYIRRKIFNFDSDFHKIQLSVSSSYVFFLISTNN